MDGGKGNLGRQRQVTSKKGILNMFSNDPKVSLLMSATYPALSTGYLIIGYTNLIKTPYDQVFCK